MKSVILSLIDGIQVFLSKDGVCGVALWPYFESIVESRYYRIVVVLDYG